MINIEHFPQTHESYHSRESCTQEIIVNTNTLHEHRRPCRKHAQYKVEGKPMCSSHAALACLAYCFKHQDDPADRDVEHN